MNKPLFFILFLSCSIYCQQKEIYQNIEKIVTETQKLVSVKKGEQIDTAAFRKLFLPTANFTVVGEENGEKLHETMSLSEFLKTLTDDYYSKGFFESGTGKVVENYKGIAHVMQSFYGKDSDGVKAYGVNSYQLIYSEKRWWIANMVWTMSNNKGKDIPEKYMKNN